MQPAPPADAPPAEPAAEDALELGERSPGGPGLVVLRNPETGDRVMATMRWGLPAQDAGGRAVLYVRAEQIAARGPVREALRRRRCIVPMDSYVQRATRGGVRGRFAVSLADDAPMAVAAIWQESGEGPCFAIVTCRANEAVGAIHDRMPVILPPQAWPLWLVPGLVSPLEVWDLLQPCPSESLRVRRLSPARRRHAPAGEPGQQLDLFAPGAPLVRPGRQPRRKRPVPSPRPAGRTRGALG
ncbi:MAG: SOS response-associated peptidase family protein [Geminicoccaceae bacterium]